MKASIIWKKLLVEGRRMVTSGEIQSLANEIGRGEERSLYYLQEEGYIVRILRGIFYVKTIEEREKGIIVTSIYKLIAMALKEKGVKNWYFGLETALKLNTMTHEYFMIDYVISDSYRTTKIIRIMDNGFKFIKRGKRHFDTGIIKEKMIRYSDPEKTVLDLSYRNYLNTKKENLYLSPIIEYKDTLNLKLLLEYLDTYPPGFRKKVRDRI